MSGILVLICCILVGFCVGLFLQRRKTDNLSFVEDLLKYIELFRVNVTTGRKTIQGFDEEFAATCGRAFADYKNNLSSGLDKDVKTLADEFFVGAEQANNSQQLLKHLDYFQTKVGSKYAEFSKNADKQKGLYVKLGLLTGAMVGLLFL